MSETDLQTETAPETQLDEDDRLRPEFVRDVLARVEAGDDQGARDLVSPLHPADIADLFELTPSDRRGPLAAALADLLDGDVLSEMNDHVREEMIDALEPHQVADIAAELDTDDAVAIIEDMDAPDQAAVLRALDHARIAEGPGGPAEMVPGQHHLRMNMYIAQVQSGRMQVVENLGAIDPDERVQAAQ